APLKSGDRVEALIAPDPAGRGRLYARHEATGLLGNIINAADVPETEKEIGKKVTLIVQSVNVAARQIAFRWPTAADQPKPKPTQGKPPPGRKPGGPPHRR